MTPPTTIPELLEAALEAELGVKVTSTSSDALRRRLYVAIRAALEKGDTRFQDLMISSGVRKEELLIKKKSSTKDV